MRSRLTLTAACQPKRVSASRGTILARVSGRTRGNAGVDQRQRHRQPFQARHAELSSAQVCRVRWAGRGMAALKVQGCRKGVLRRGMSIEVRLGGHSAVLSGAGSANPAHAILARAGVAPGCARLAAICTSVTPSGPGTSMRRSWRGRLSRQTPGRWRGSPLLRHAVAPIQQTGQRQARGQRQHQHIARAQQRQPEAKAGSRHNCR